MAEDWLSPYADPQGRIAKGAAKADQGSVAAVADSGASGKDQAGRHASRRRWISLPDAGARAPAFLLRDVFLPCRRSGILGSGHTPAAATGGLARDPSRRLPFFRVPSCGDDSREGGLLAARVDVGAAVRLRGEFVRDLKRKPLQYAATVAGGKTRQPQSSGHDP
jgi:hypothetical protein